MPSLESYTTYVEVNLEPHITPDYFKRFLTKLRTDVRKITPESTSLKELCVEDGKYTTYVETYSVPLLSERYAVLTEYRSLDA